MNQQDIKHILNRIESNYPVSEWEHEGVSVWPILRVKLWALLCNRTLNVADGQSSLSVSFTAKVRRVLLIPFVWLTHSLKDLSKSYFRIPKGDILVLGDGISFIKIKEKYFDKFSDSLSMLLSDFGLDVVRLDGSTKFYKPRFISSYYIQPRFDYIMFKALVKTKIFTKTLSLEGKNEVQEIADKYDLGYLFNDSQIHYEAERVKMISNHFTGVLKRGGFKAVMSVCYYNAYGFGLNLAASKLGIPTYDIQHGVQGDNHGAYGSWVNFPKTGYDLLPNYFLSWSEYEKQGFDRWTHQSERHQCLVSGNWLMNFWMSDNNPWKNQHDGELRTIRNSSKPRVLVTLGWDISTEEYISGTISAIASTQEDYLWLIRLHPSMLEEQSIVEEMLAKNGIKTYEIEICSRVPLFSLLPMVDMHITHSSTTSIEASWFGIKSIVTSDYGWSLLDQQVSPGYLIKAETAEEILMSIRTEALTIGKNEEQSSTKTNSENKLKQLVNTFQ